MTVKTIKCPVCGQTELTDDGDVCSVCGWFHDVVQEKYPDEEDGENEMSLNQARRAFFSGQKVF